MCGCAVCMCEHVMHLCDVCAQVKAHVSVCEHVCGVGEHVCGPWQGSFLCQAAGYLLRQQVGVDLGPVGPGVFNTKSAQGWAGAGAVTAWTEALRSSAQMLAQTPDSPWPCPVRGGPGPRPWQALRSLWGGSGYLSWAGSLAQLDAKLASMGPIAGPRPSAHLMPGTPEAPTLLEPSWTPSPPHWAPLLCPGRPSAHLMPGVPAAPALLEVPVVVFAKCLEDDGGDGHDGLHQAELQSGLGATAPGGPGARSPRGPGMGVGAAGSGQPPDTGRGGAGLARWEEGGQGWVDPLTCLQKRRNPME